MKAAILLLVVFILFVSFAYAQQSDAIQEKFKQAEQLKVLQQKDNQPTAVLPQGKQSEQPSQMPTDRKTAPETPPPAQISTTTTPAPSAQANAQEVVTPPAQVPAPPAPTASAAAKVSMIGEKITFNDSEWIVTDAQIKGKSMKSNNPFQEDATTEGKFVIVAFKIKNLSNKEERILDTPKIVDSQGREFREYDKGSFYIPENGKTLIMDALPSGLQKQFYAVYEVADDAKGFKFQARALSINGDKKLLDLGL